MEDHGLALLSSSNWSEVGEYLSDFMSKSVLTPLGDRQRASRFGGFKVGPLSFAFVDFGSPMRIKAEIIRDYHLAMCCLQGTADLKIDGSPVHLNEGDGLLAQPCMSLEGQFSADCRRLLVRIDPRLMPGQTYPTLQQNISLIDPNTSPWLGQINLILSSSTIMQSILGCREVAAHMEGLLLALLRMDGAPYAPGAQQRSQIVSRAVRRAEAFVRLNATREISLADIVEVSGVCTRALQNSFMHFRQLTPMQYLRDVRLGLVHERLRKEGNRTSISQVALESGFNHLGRFSTFYRARYGETPSQTVRLAEHRWK